MVSFLWGGGGIVVLGSFVGYGNKGIGKIHYGFLICIYFWDQCGKAVFCRITSLVW